MATAISFEFKNSIVQNNIHIIMRTKVVNMCAVAICATKINEIKLWIALIESKHFQNNGYNAPVIKDFI